MEKELEANIGETERERISLEGKIGNEETVRRDRGSGAHQHCQEPGNDVHRVYIYSLLIYM